MQTPLWSSVPLSRECIAQAGPLLSQVERLDARAVCRSVTYLMLDKFHLDDNGSISDNDGGSDDESSSNNPPSPSRARSKRERSGSRGPRLSLKNLGSKAWDLGSKAAALGSEVTSKVAGELGQVVDSANAKAALAGEDSPNDAGGLKFRLWAGIAACPVGDVDKDEVVPIMPAVQVMLVDDTVSTVGGQLSIDMEHVKFAVKLVPVPPPESASPQGRPTEGRGTESKRGGERNSDSWGGESSRATDDGEHHPTDDGSAGESAESGESSEESDGKERTQKHGPMLMLVEIYECGTIVHAEAHLMQHPHAQMEKEPCAERIKWSPQNNDQVPNKRRV